MHLHTHTYTCTQLKLTHRHTHNTHTHTHTHTHLILPYMQVYRLPVEECSNFTDCSSCTTSGGRLCGWCSVENKCSRRSQCSNSTSSLRWVQDSGTCLSVSIASAESISGDVNSYPREQRTIVSVCNFAWNCYILAQVIGENTVETYPLAIVAYIVSYNISIILCRLFA